MQLTLSTPITPSFRVHQIGGMFDVPILERATETIAVDVPSLDVPYESDPASLASWRVGLIVGPSGSGKTSFARRLFGASFIQPAAWSPECAVIDEFPRGLTTRTIARLLTAVGFGSPPSWIKPYAVLSNGERHRCDLARALTRNIVHANEQSRVARTPEDETTNPKPPLTVFDEFTSVVDRNVARSVAVAVAKSIRAEHVPGRFVAVSCHTDVAEWLAPDWVLDMGARTFTRRLLRRPDIRLELARCGRDLWPLFARHHYLSAKLNPAARCYIARWPQEHGRAEPVCFIAVLPLIGKRGQWRITRLVTLPDYQGLGIGPAAAEAVAALYAEQGLRMTITASHPSVLRHCTRSPAWRAGAVRKQGSPGAKNFRGDYRGSPGRATASFEYVGSAVCGVRNESATTHRTMLAATR